jgi:1-acyl-sn-glycerol-3-phosphate acyltransferase
MRRDETMLVFPGGGRDMLKFKGEEYHLNWEGRSGFARLAIAHDYPIVPVGLVGGDDVFHSLVARNSAWERMTRTFGERMHGIVGVGVPLMRGLGPTLLPRPQRMYLRFGQPISTVRPARRKVDKWEATVKQRTQAELETILADLQELRQNDPFRNLNPLRWGAALRPKVG